MVEKNIIFSIFFFFFYQEKTKDFRIPYCTEKNVNATESKEAIITQVPSLLEQISRKDLLLKLGVEVSNEISESVVF